MISFAASYRNPPATYGSIELGTQVAHYRKQIFAQLRAEGMSDYSKMATIAEQKILKKFGERKVYR